MRRTLQALALILPAAFCGCSTLQGSGPVYLVRIERGDTLAQLAAKYDTTPERIEKLNGLAGAAAPVVGAVLRLQPGPGGLVAGAAPAAVGSKHKTRGDKADAETLGDEFEEEGLTSGGSTVRPHRGGLLFGGATANSHGLDWPIYGEITSGYGKRRRDFHKGVDIRARRGTAVLAAGDGVVEFAGRQHGYGRVVIIRHYDVKTLYAHLGGIDVHVGQRVNHGTDIGEVGTSGNSTGPHLHFEIRTLKDRTLDPLTVLNKEKLLSSAH